MDPCLKSFTNPKGYARILFVDFSSAFSSIKTHLLLKRLVDLNVNQGLVLWIRNCLCCRPQRVCVKGVMSDVLTVSNGCPQGCVLSPVLFSIFTNEFTINEENFRLFKYADDMALVGLLDKTNQTYDLAYLTHNKALETWCCSSQLEINFAKTKELIMCTRRDVICKPISLESQQVEIVEHFKYLGSILDSQLSFADNSEYIFKRCSQRLFLLRQLSGLGVSKHILELVYKSIVESVLTFHLPVWYEHLNSRLKNKLSRIVSSANKIIGRPQNQLTQLCGKDKKEDESYSCRWLSSSFQPV